MALPAPVSEYLSSPEWHDLQPSLLDKSSLTVETALDRVNAAFPVPGPLQAAASIGELLQSVEAPTEPRTRSPLPILRSPPQSPFEEGVTEDVIPPTSMVTSVTVHREDVVPLTAQARGITVNRSAAPHKQPVAQKCPRPEYTRKVPPKKLEVKNKPERPQKLTALREIKCLQKEYKPVLPLAPFARAVRSILHQHGPFKLTREALANCY